MNSKQKGKRGELEVAALIRSYGFEARRGQQFKGGKDSPDVIHSVPDTYIEVKLRQAFNLHETMEKAEQEAREEDQAVVFHRKNHKEWLVTLYAHDFLTLMQERESHEPKHYL